MGNVWADAFWIPDEMGMMDPWRWREKSSVRMIEGFDVFASSVPEATRDSVFAVMAVATHHRFFVVSAHADAMQAYLSDPAVQQRVQRMSDLMVPIARATGPVYADAQESLGTHTRWPLPNVRLYCSVAGWGDPWGYVPVEFRVAEAGRNDLQFWRGIVEYYEEIEAWTGDGLPSFLREFLKEHYPEALL